MWSTSFLRQWQEVLWILSNSTNIETKHNGSGSAFTLSIINNVMQNLFLDVVPQR
jgi:hypothetical protein